MGLKYNKNDGQLLASALEHNLSIAEQIISDLQEGVSRLTSALESGELSGKAYHAANTLFKSMIEPTLTQLKSATSEIKSDLNQYKSAISAFDHFNDLVYDKAEITHALEIKRQQKATVENQILFFNDTLTTGLAKNAVENLFFEGKQLESVLSHYEQEIQKLEDKLRILEETSWQTSALFKDSLEVFQSALKEAKSLRKGTFDSKGNFKVKEPLNTLEKDLEKIKRIGGITSAYAGKTPKIKDSNKLKDLTVKKIIGDYGSIELIKIQNENSIISGKQDILSNTRKSFGTKIPGSKVHIGNIWGGSSTLLSLNSNIFKIPMLPIYIKGGTGISKTELDFYNGTNVKGDINVGGGAMLTAAEANGSASFKIPFIGKTLTLGGSASWSVGATGNLAVSKQDGVSGGIKFGFGPGAGFNFKIK